MKQRFIARKKASDGGVTEQIPARGVPVFFCGFRVRRSRQSFFEQLLSGIDSTFPIQALEKFVPPAPIERGEIIKPRARAPLRGKF